MVLQKFTRIAGLGAFKSFSVWREVAQNLHLSLMNTSIFIFN
ncbi:MAG: hypothetical protein RLY82_878, partial [Pseudomonadota bacterium]